jgi:hypothetical protein
MKSTNIKDITENKSANIDPKKEEKIEGIVKRLKFDEKTSTELAKLLTNEINKFINNDGWSSLKTAITKQIEDASKKIDLQNQELQENNKSLLEEMEKLPKEKIDAIYVTMLIATVAYAKHSAKYKKKFKTTPASDEYTPVLTSTMLKIAHRTEGSIKSILQPAVDEEDKERYYWNDSLAIHIYNFIITQNSNSLPQNSLLAKAYDDLRNETYTTIFEGLYASTRMAYDGLLKTNFLQWLYGELTGFGIEITLPTTKDTPSMPQYTDSYEILKKNSTLAKNNENPTLTENKKNPTLAESFITNCRMWIELKTKKHIGGSFTIYDIQILKGVFGKDKVCPGDDAEKFLKELNLIELDIQKSTENQINEIYNALINNDIDRALNSITISFIDLKLNKEISPVNINAMLLDKVKKDNLKLPAQLQKLTSKNNSQENIILLYFTNKLHEKKVLAKAETMPPIPTSLAMIINLLYIKFILIEHEDSSGEIIKKKIDEIVSISVKEIINSVRMILEHTKNPLDELKHLLKVIFSDIATTVTSQKETLELENSFTIPANKQSMVNDFIFEKIYFPLVNAILETSYLESDKNQELSLQTITEKVIHTIKFLLNPQEELYRQAMHHLNEYIPRIIFLKQKDILNYKNKNTLLNDVYKDLSDGFDMFSANSSSQTLPNTEDFPPILQQYGADNTIIIPEKLPNSESAYKKCSNIITSSAIEQLQRIIPPRSIKYTTQKTPIKYTIQKTPEGFFDIMLLLHGLEEIKSLCNSLTSKEGKEDREIVLKYADLFKKELLYRIDKINQFNELYKILSPLIDESKSEAKAPFSKKVSTIITQLLLSKTSIDKKTLLTIKQYIQYLFKHYGAQLATPTESNAPNEIKIPTVDNQPKSLVSELNQAFKNIQPLKQKNAAIQEITQYILDEFKNIKVVSLRKQNEQAQAYINFLERSLKAPEENAPSPETKITNIKSDDQKISQEDENKHPFFDILNNDIQEYIKRITAIASISEQVPDPNNIYAPLQKGALLPYEELQHCLQLVTKIQERVYAKEFSATATDNDKFKIFLELVTPLINAITTVLSKYPKNQPFPELIVISIVEKIVGNNGIFKALANSTIQNKEQQGMVLNLLTKIDFDKFTSNLTRLEDIYPVALILYNIRLVEVDKKKTTINYDAIIQKGLKNILLIYTTPSISTPFAKFQCIIRTIEKLYKLGNPSLKTPLFSLYQKTNNFMFDLICPRLTADLLTSCKLTNNSGLPLATYIDDMLNILVQSFKDNEIQPTIKIINDTTKIKINNNEEQSCDLMYLITKDLMDAIEEAPRDFDDYIESLRLHKKFEILQNLKELVMELLNENNFPPKKPDENEKDHQKKTYEDNVVSNRIAIGKEYIKKIINILKTTVTQNQVKNTKDDLAGALLLFETLDKINIVPKELMDKDGQIKAGQIKDLWNEHKVNNLIKQLQTNIDLIKQLKTNIIDNVCNKCFQSKDSTIKNEFIGSILFAANKLKKADTNTMEKIVSEEINKISNNTNMPKNQIWTLNICLYFIKSCLQELITIEVGDIKTKKELATIDAKTKQAENLINIIKKIADVSITTFSNAPKTTKDDTSKDKAINDFIAKVNQFSNDILKIIAERCKEKHIILGNELDAIKKMNNNLEKQQKPMNRTFSYANISSFLSFTPKLFSTQSMTPPPSPLPTDFDANTRPSSTTPSTEEKSNVSSSQSTPSSSLEKPLSPIKKEDKEDKNAYVSRVLPIFEQIVGNFADNTKKILHTNINILRTKLTNNYLYSQISLQLHEYLEIVVAQAIENYKKFGNEYKFAAYEKNPKAFISTIVDKIILVATAPDNQSTLLNMIDSTHIDSKSRFAQEVITLVFGSEDKKNQDTAQKANQVAPVLILLAAYHRMLQHKKPPSNIDDIMDPITQNSLTSIIEKMNNNFLELQKDVKLFENKMSNDEVLNIFILAEIITTQFTALQKLGDQEELELIELIRPRLNELMCKLALYSDIRVTNDFIGNHMHFIAAVCPPLADNPNKQEWEIIRKDLEAANTYASDTDTLKDWFAKEKQKYDGLKLIPESLKNDCWKKIKKYAGEDDKKFREELSLIKKTLFEKDSDVIKNDIFLNRIARLEEIMLNQPKPQEEVHVIKWLNNELNKYGITPPTYENKLELIDVAALRKQFLDAVKQKFKDVDKKIGDTDIKTTTPVITPEDIKILEKIFDPQTGICGDIETYKALKSSQFYKTQDSLHKKLIAPEIMYKKIAADLDVDMEKIITDPEKQRQEASEILKHKISLRIKQLLIEIRKKLNNTQKLSSPMDQLREEAILESLTSKIVNLSLSPQIIPNVNNLDNCMKDLIKKIYPELSKDKAYQDKARESCKSELSQIVYNLSILRIETKNTQKGLQNTAITTDVLVDQKFLYVYRNLAEKYIPHYIGNNEEEINQDAIAAKSDAVFMRSMHAEKGNILREKRDKLLKIKGDENWSDDEYTTNMALLLKSMDKEFVMLYTPFDQKLTKVFTHTMVAYLPFLNEGISTNIRGWLTDPSNAVKEISLSSNDQLKKQLKNNCLFHVNYHIVAAPKLEPKLNATDMRMLVKLIKLLPSDDKQTALPLSEQQSTTDGKSTQINLCSVADLYDNFLSKITASTFTDETEPMKTVFKALKTDLTKLGKDEVNLLTEMFGENIFTILGTIQNIFGEDSLDMVISSRKIFRGIIAAEPKHIITLLKKIFTKDNFLDDFKCLEKINKIFSVDYLQYCEIFNKIFFENQKVDALSKDDQDTLIKLFGEDYVTILNIINRIFVQNEKKIAPDDLNLVHEVFGNNLLDMKALYETFGPGKACEDKGKLFFKQLRFVCGKYPLKYKENQLNSLPENKKSSAITNQKSPLLYEPQKKSPLSLSVQDWITRELEQNYEIKITIPPNRSSDKIEILQIPLIKKQFEKDFLDFIKEKPTRENENTDVDDFLFVEKTTKKLTPTDLDFIKQIFDPKTGICPSSEVISKVEVINGDEEKIKNMLSPPYANDNDECASLLNDLFIRDKFIALFWKMINDRDTITPAMVLAFNKEVFGEFGICPDEATLIKFNNAREVIEKVNNHFSKILKSLDSLQCSVAEKMQKIITALSEIANLNSIVVLPNEAVSKTARTIIHAQTIYELLNKLFSLANTSTSDERLTAINKVTELLHLLFTNLKTTIYINNILPLLLEKCSTKDKIISNKKYSNCSNILHYILIDLQLALNENSIKTMSISAIRETLQQINEIKAILNQDDDIVTSNITPNITLQLQLTTTLNNVEKTAIYYLILRTPTDEKINNYSFHELAALLNNLTAIKSIYLIQAKEAKELSKVIDETIAKIRSMTFFITQDNMEKNKEYEITFAELTKTIDLLVDQSIRKNLSAINIKRAEKTKNVITQEEKNLKQIEKSKDEIKQLNEKKKVESSVDKAYYDAVPLNTLIKNIISSGITSKSDKKYNWLTIGNADLDKGNLKTLEKKLSLYQDMVNYGIHATISTLINNPDTLNDENILHALSKEVSLIYQTLFNSFNDINGEITKLDVTKKCILNILQFCLDEITHVQNKVLQSQDLKVQQQIIVAKIKENLQKEIERCKSSGLPLFFNQSGSTSDAKDVKIDSKNETSEKIAMDTLYKY